ncbi:MAG: CheR family methyltransferase [Gemmatimonadaceae bacterium]
MASTSEPIAFGPPVLGARDFAFLQELIKRTAGIHLTEQKKSLVEGRLAKRLRFHGMRDYKEYIELLQNADPCGGEMLELINAITTNKTSFFREQHHFDFLLRETFPSFGGRSIRVWSAGCSTGEEPYSIAMTARDARVSVEIFATDIDTKVLATAKAGVYAEDRVTELSPDLVRRHFLRGDGSKAGLYRVRPDVQQMVTFERVNLADGAWPDRGLFDVIFCRNVIIYFNRETQDTLFRRFAERLVPGGAMIVGHSENLSWLTELFAPVGKTIYRRSGDAPRRTVLDVRPRPVARVAPEAAAQPRRKLVRIEAGGVHASRDATEIRTVLGSCVAACIYDPALGVGGMNHFMLPVGENTDRPARYGVHAMELLINEVMKLGGERSRLRAKVFGGASVIRALKTGADVGRKNAEFIRAFLATERIPIDAEQLGGTNPLEVRFNTDTSKVRVRALDSERDRAVFKTEEQVAIRAPEPVRPAADADVDAVLF